MVKFVWVIDAWFVQIRDKSFGVINKNGLFLSSQLVTETVLLEAKDLRLIAAKMDEVAGNIHDVWREADDKGRPKLVCRSPGCRGAELQMKPGTNVEDWAEAREEFLIKHRCERVKKA